MSISVRGGGGAVYTVNRHQAASCFRPSAAKAGSLCYLRTHKRIKPRSDRGDTLKFPLSFARSCRAPSSLPRFSHASVQGREAALPPNVCRIRACSASHSRSSSSISPRRRDGTGQTTTRRSNTSQPRGTRLPWRGRASHPPDKNAFAFQAGSQSSLVRGTRWQRAR